VPCAPALAGGGALAGGSPELRHFAEGAQAIGGPVAAWPYARRAVRIEESLVQFQVDAWADLCRGNVSRQSQRAMTVMSTGVQ
jgi:hypothetical protein